MQCRIRPAGGTEWREPRRRQFRFLGQSDPISSGCGGSDVPRSKAPISLGYRWAPELNPSVYPMPFCENSRKEQEPRSKTSSSVMNMGCLFAYTFSMNFYNNPFESSYCQFLHFTEEETEARLQNLALGPTVPKAAGWRSWLVSPLHSSAGRAGQGHRLRAQRELR